MLGPVKNMPNFVNERTVVSLNDETLACELSLAVKTECFGPSSARVQSLICAALEAGLLYRVPRLQAIHCESIAALSTIEMIFAPSADSRMGA